MSVQKTPHSRSFNVRASLYSAQVRLSELNIELLRQVFIHVHHTEYISITLIGQRCFLSKSLTRVFSLAHWACLHSTLRALQQGALLTAINLTLRLISSSRCHLKWIAPGRRKKWHTVYSCCVLIRKRSYCVLYACVLLCVINGQTFTESL